MSARPVWLEWIETRVKGRAGHRLMVILKAPGCEFALNEGPCTVCSFPGTMGTHQPASTQDLLEQMEHALRAMPKDASGPSEIDIYCSGSFLNPNEIPTEAQTALIERIAREPLVEKVLVESRPEYVSAEKLLELTRLLGNKRLEVGIGLESANEEIREKRIKKGFTLEQFEKAAADVANGGASMLTYVLLKPIDTGEAEAIIDAVETSKKVFELGLGLDLQVKIGLEPCFVGPDTALTLAHRQGRYRPPWLWSVIEVVKKIAPLGPVLVGLSNEGLSTQESAHNCDRCTERVRGALAEFNSTQESTRLISLNCDCKKEWASLGI